MTIIVEVERSKLNEECIPLPWVAEYFAP